MRLLSAVHKGALRLLGLGSNPSAVTLVRHRAPSATRLGLGLLTLASLGWSTVVLASEASVTPNQSAQLAMSPNPPIATDERSAAPSDVADSGPLAQHQSGAAPEAKHAETTRPSPSGAPPAGSEAVQDTGHQRSGTGWVIAPETTATVGNGIPGAVDVGAGLLFRFGGVWVGPRAAMSVFMLSTLEGDEPHDQPFYAHRRIRFGASAELHGESRRIVQPWCGLDLEVDATSGDPTNHYDGRFPDEWRWGPFITLKGGVDFVHRWDKGIAGIGAFGGLPVSAVSDLGGPGFMLGVRAVVGGF